MQVSGPDESREPRTENVAADLVICGGGLAGCCAAITAARAGLRVILVHDRPVLGGNASSEIRLWALGATAHMGNNNRWAREGGVIDEIVVENTYRNPDGNALLFDTILLEKVIGESRITLLLNTAVYAVRKSAEYPNRIEGLRAFCSQNSKRYELDAPLFIDSSGDGIVGFLAGAAFRMGAENSEEFEEGFAPSQEYGELLGHSIYFMTKDVGHRVPFVPPSYAYKDVEKIVPRYRDINVAHQGCQFWWIEYGGRLDTVHDTEQIRWELWRIVYGVWDYIKNSGRFPDVDNLTLEWVGHIPGKRESRRFEGDYILNQKDLVQQREHSDAVSYGGWALDLHPADGVFSEKPGCNQWHTKGVYQVPYRCLYSRNIENLFLAGRIISCSHVAFGSTRVMMSCAHHAQAVGMAAALCREQGCQPREIYSKDHVPELQNRLLRAGQYIPCVAWHDEQDLARRSRVEPSSELSLGELVPDGPERRLSESWAMMIPVQAGRIPRIGIFARADQPTELVCEVRISSKPGNHTPDVVLAKQVVALEPTTQSAAALAQVHAKVNSDHERRKSSHTAVPEEAAWDHISVEFRVDVEHPQYAFICFVRNPEVTLRCSEQRVSGVLALHHKVNRRVATHSTQVPPDDLGIESFEIWRPKRRPDGHNLAMTLEPALDRFAAANAINGIDRPVAGPNAWVADPDDPAPALTFHWDHPQTIQSIALAFDTDFDHPMETTLWQHPERITPFCVQQYRVLDEHDNILATCSDNHQTLNHIVLDKPVRTRLLRVEMSHPPSGVPASLMGLRCYDHDITRVI